MHHVVGVISTFTAEIDRRKAKVRHVVLFFHIQKARLVFTGDVGFENGFLPDPIGTFFGNCFLRQLISKLNFKLGSIETFFSG